MKKVSGLQVMQEIEKEKIYCLFVVLSAYRDFEYAKQACDLGAFAYLLKPINDDELRQTMCGAYESCMGQIQNEEKLERWEDLIVKDKDTFLKVILQKYVKNKLSIEKVEQAFQTLDTTLEKNDKFITAYVDVDLSYKITNSLDYEAKKFAMLQLLENYIGASFFYWAFESEENAIIFIIKALSGESVITLKQLFEMVKEKDYPVVAAISKPYKGIEGIQINDTHPTMVIPELIRILTEEKNFNIDTAVDVVSKSCAYTNHTILAEALEKWPISYLEKVVPQLMPIIRDLDRRVRRDFHDERVYIIDNMDRVHMAHIDIHFGYAVNGVAALHTEILKESELKPFYDIYPQKFNNKTNGITFRRWLVHCNHDLAEYIKELIGPGYMENAEELEKLLQYKDDEKVLEKLREIKGNAKKELKNYLKMTQNVDIDENAIFDIQIKRLHEYKRQQMNALYAIWKYKEIKKGNLPKRPLTMIFGAKAAPAYTVAKDIIHLILCLQQLIDNDPEVSPYFKIVMVENYNVTKAEKLIPSCDISEQISLASKEASGTGNMKFMLNGAVTLGTEDGANVEIHQLVGDDNIYIFGEKSEKIIKLYETGEYCAADIYDNDPMVEELVDFIISKDLMRIGDPVNLGRLYKEIVEKDWFMALLDVKDYIQTKEQMLKDYEDKNAWAKKMLVNIAKAGFFSSDRTIAEYNQDIWHL